MPFLKRGNNYAKDNRSNLDILREAHFGDSLTSFEVNKGSDVRNYCQLPPNLSEFLTLELLDKAIAEMPTGKTPGPDKVKNEVFAKLPREYRQALLDQYRASIAMGFIPSKWLEMEAIFIEKAGKPDKTSPKTYRPIGLSSSFLKLGERLVNWHLKTTVLANGIPKQHAFTLNRSTETAISELVNLLEKAKCNKMKAMVVSIDIEGAFDNVPFKVIEESLREHGASEHIIAWIDFLSKNRNVRASQGRVTIHFRPNKGTTQGGLNGPDIWIICLWNIIFLEAARSTSSSTFADDVFSALIGHDLNSMRDVLQRALNEFNAWFTSKGLKISAHKSFCMIVGQTTKDPTPKPLTISGMEVPYVKEMKYLGVIIDCNLTWKAHVSNRIRKAKRDLMLARRLISNSWGLTPDKMMWVYEGIVRPALDYACHIWTPTNNPPSWLTKELDKVQRLALVNVTSCLNSTPTRALERLLDVPPLYLHLKQKAACTVARIYNSVHKANWDGISPGNKRGHLFRWRSYLGKELDPMEDIARYNLNNFTVNLTQTQEMPPGWCIYTDGSKTDSGVGLGWLISKDLQAIAEGSLKLNDYASVYEAEIAAIIVALTNLKECIKGKARPQEVTVLVDNQSALHTLNKTKLSGRLRVDLINCVENTQKSLQTQIKFQWVKSHVGTVGNELADELAKAGTSAPNAFPVPQSIGYIKKKLKERTYNAWNKLWNELKDCRQSKELIDFTPSSKNRTYLLQSTRTKCKNIVALITGHNHLNYHTFKRFVVHNPNFSPCCRFCKQDVETSWHLLYSCEALDKKRREFEFGPDNPKKGPDIKIVSDRAVHLGIMELVRAKLDV